MPTGIIGLGNMGSALAHLVTGNGHAVLGWEFDAAVVAQINSHRRSPYLPGITLHPALRATQDLSAVIADCPVVFIALPARFIESTLQPHIAHWPAQTIVVNLAKGIDPDSGETAFACLARLLPANPRVQLSGPSIANQYAHGQATAVMIAGDNPTALTAISALLDNAFFRTRHSSDPAGVVLSGVLKNIYALGLGLLAGHGIDNTNFQGAYLTLAIAEMQQLGEALGARPESFLGIAGLGDLIATALSEHSHNVRMGRLLASGKPLAMIERAVGTLPEGYYTLLTARQLAAQHGIALPLAEGLYALIQGTLTATRLAAMILRGRP